MEVIIGVLEILELFSSLGVKELNRMTFAPDSQLLMTASRFASLRFTFIQTSCIMKETAGIKYLY